MIICEYSFNEPDNVKPMYSFREIDFYAYIPYTFIAEVPQHRLSMRKNLTKHLIIFSFLHTSDELWQEITRWNTKKIEIRFWREPKDITGDTESRGYNTLRSIGRNIETRFVNGITIITAEIERKSFKELESGIEKIGMKYLSGGELDIGKYFTKLELELSMHLEENVHVAGSQIGEPCKLTIFMVAEQKSLKALFSKKLEHLPITTKLLTTLTPLDTSFSVPTVTGLKDTKKEKFIESKSNIFFYNGFFEVYRFYHETLKEEVVFEGTLEKALEFGDNEVKRFWGSFGRREPDMVCQHKPPIIDRFCPNARSEAYHGV